MPIRKIERIHNIKNLFNFHCEHEFVYNDSKNESILNNKLKNPNEYSGKQVFVKKTIDIPSDVIIYAPNGNGKTSLSRCLSCWDRDKKIFDPYKIDQIKSIECKEKVLEMPKIDFFDNNMKNTILVYNYDFISDNIIKEFSNNKESKGYLILNKESGDSKIFDLLKNFKNFFVLENKLIKFKKNSLEAKFNQKLQELKKEYNFRSEGEFKFENLNENFINKKQENFDEEQDYISILKQLKSIKEEDKIIIPSFKNIEFDTDELEKILSNEENFPDAEKEITEYIMNIGRDWIKFGVEKIKKEKIEDNKWKCPFCQQNVENDLFTKYKKFFEETKKGLFLNKIDKILENLRNIYSEIQNNI
ncbi:MAG: AAA family ATPase, partial [Rickettsiales bacterium]|nr:AAA family ATPase [Rickettsiales bacterium]